MRKRSAAAAPKASDVDFGSTPSEEEIAQIARDVVDPETIQEQIAAPKFHFRSVNARPERDAKLREDLVQIVDTVWVENMHETWKAIKASLTIGSRRSEHGVLSKALDEARRLSYEAHRLWATASRERDRWELENEVVHSAMWNEAERALEAERADKARSKPITDTDVRAKIMTMHPEEYIAQESKRRAVKLTVENMSALVKEANEHVDDIRALLVKLRG